ncbi:hypothetical protein SAMN05444004_10883 [Jannaschia faecimaris]|uniref:Uncharacterized protein n=1 Tax=Jannaschia faecimaris TaxID=1244108 RepID=A0A1H3RGD0_9RHOB|nr:hypothetical protein [Jannaschia faecimaris]SDZ23999.1 hypothetical protein SAMN05444004_10883 [Jannaschia faecimaris]
MGNLFHSLSDQTYRLALGQRIEVAIGQAFNVLRWAIVVGFARFLTMQAGSIWFNAIYWATSAMLFGYLASLFLLRPEVPLFRSVDRLWKRRLQTVANLVLCMVAFMLVFQGINALVDGIAVYRFSR